MILTGLDWLIIVLYFALWKFLLAIGAGTGLVYLLRWYWWRINAWSEVSAMAAALLLSLGFQFGLGLNPDDPTGFAWLMLLTVAGTTAVWLIVTFLTSPEPMAHLRTFCSTVNPGGAGWRKVTGTGEGGPGARDLVRWLLGCVVVYLGLFGVGSLLLGHPGRGAGFLAAAVLLGAWIAGGLRGEVWYHNGNFDPERAP